MGPTLAHLKLFTRNVPEADTCTTWNYAITPGAAQKENANGWHTFEHKPKMWQFPIKNTGPSFDHFGPDHHRKILLYKHGLKKPSLQAISH